MSMQGWWALFALGVALALTFNYAQLIIEIAWIVFGAFLLSLAMRPLADQLLRQNVPRGLTVIGIYIAFAGLIFAIAKLLVPIIYTEVVRLQESAPVLLQSILTQLATTPLDDWLPVSDTVVQNLAQRLDSVVIGAVGTVAGISSLLIDLLVMLILAYFFAVEEDWLGPLLLTWVPIEHQARVEQVFLGIRQRLTRWIWAQLTIAVYFAATFSVGLTLLGVPFALTIGLIGGMLEIVPYLGGAVAVTLAMVSALSVSPWLALWVFLFYVVVWVIQGHLLAPVIYGRAIGLRSTSVLLVLLIGAKAQGAIGVFFAVPVAVVLTALIQEIQANRARPVSEPAEPEPVQPKIA
jgi:predicted PurR-regulated permease PerM